MSLYSGTILFSNFWDCPPIPNYVMSVLPGRMEGITGSCILGFNLGVSNYISDDRKSAAIKVLNFFTSRSIQKEIIMKQFYLYSGISSLYDDKEVCSILDCNFKREVQTVIKPFKEVEDYNSYSKKFLSLLYEGLYEEKDPLTVLQKIDDITKIYNFTIKTETVALVVFILLIVIICIIIISACLIFIPRFEKYFTFLSKDLWIFYTVGAIITTGSQFTNFNQLSIIKCNVGRVMLTIGFTMIFIPLLYKLIVNFPQKNKFSSWISGKKIPFIVIILSIEVILNLFYIVYPIEVEDIMADNYKNYSKCKSKTINSLIVSLIQSSTKIILLISICVLIFLEWNIEETIKDMRALTTIICMNVVLLFVFFVISFININNYIVFYYLYTMIILTFTLLNHFYMFVLRVFTQSSLWERPEHEEMANKFFNAKNDEFKDVLASSLEENKIDREYSQSKGSIINGYRNKLLNLHFAKTCSSSSINSSSTKRYSCSSTNNKSNISNDDTIERKRSSLYSSNNDYMGPKKPSLSTSNNDYMGPKKTSLSTSNNNYMDPKNNH